jgi:hypothetical protein
MMLTQVFTVDSMNPPSPVTAHPPVDSAFVIAALNFVSAVIRHVESTAPAAFRVPVS